MSKPKKRGPKPKGIAKVTRKYTLDISVAADLESSYAEGKRSAAVNEAIKEKLEREAWK